MSLNYDRKIQLSVEGGSGSIDLSEMRIRFRIEHSEQTRPPTGVFIISNLKAETERKLQKEGKKVTINAGYKDNFGLLFRGEIIQTVRGRESPTDTTFTILARNSDLAHTYAVVNKSLSAGHTWKDRVDVALEAMKPYGVTAGFIANLGASRFPRGYIMSGMAKDFLRELAEATATTWSIQNGKLQIVKNNSTLPGDAVVLNSRTGLIGRPNQTFNGIEATCLLNPKIRPGVKLKIDQASINRQMISPDYGAGANNATIPDIDMDGNYKVLYVDEQGDSRGGPWYTTAICHGAQTPIPIAVTQRGISNVSVFSQDQAVQ